MKLVYFTDPHTRGTNPRARTDSYFDAITGKLAWVVNLANELPPVEATLLVCGGDLFDSPDVSYSVTAAVAVILRKAQVPILVVAGNHDLWAYNPETINRTPLGLLAKLDIIQLLTPKQGFYLPDERVRVTGRWFDWDVDRSIADYTQLAGGPEARIRVHVVHGMAVERPLPAGIRCTVLQEAPFTDVVLTAHEHIGYGVRRFGRTLWCNPGALGRLSARIEEIVRQPRVAIVTIPPEGLPSIELRDVPCQPGDKVLSRDELREEAAREERLTEFLDLLRGEAESTHIFDVPALIRYLAQREGYAAEIATEALRRLEQAREDLSGRRSV